MYLKYCRKAPTLPKISTKYSHIGISVVLLCESENFCQCSKNTACNGFNFNPLKLQENHEFFRKIRDVFDFPAAAFLHLELKMEIIE